MSHSVYAALAVTQKEKLIAACDQLGYKVEQNIRHKMYDGELVFGTRVTIPGWAKPVMVDHHGKVVYDNYGGSWGDLADLNKLAQRYSLLVEQQVAQDMGALSDFEELPNGDIRLRIEIPTPAAEVEQDLWAN